MGRPAKGKRVLATVRLEVGLMARVDAFAAEAGSDRSSALVELVTLGLGAPSASAIAPGTTAARAKRSPKPKPSASAPVQAAASAVASLAPTVRSRPRTLVGYDAITDEPIYRGD